MKAFLVLIVCNIFILSASYANACYDSSCSPEQSNPCNEFSNKCECTDINCGKNGCLDKTSCCQHFGNVGDNKFSEGDTDIGDQ